MKVVILCGGLGTRLREETEFRPKPMVDVGGRPILWHIMKIYAHYGLRDFLLCLGYRGNVIKEYFLNYEAMNNDFTVTLGKQHQIVPHGAHQEQDFQVTLVETGAEAMTGARVKRIERFVDGDTFLVTYGDGLADIDIRALLDFHRSHGKLATVSTMRPVSRFGLLDVDPSGAVRSFAEKPQTEGWANAGYFVFHRRVFEYLADDDRCILERDPMERLVADGQLMAYRHEGFFFAMDTYREYEALNKMWDSGACAVEGLGVIAVEKVFADRSVFVTGHTGFKGSWLAIWLHALGARVTGYSLPPPTEPSNFAASGVGELLAAHHEGDIRDAPALNAALAKADPDIVFHLAAQALVRSSYAAPRETFEVNVIGTAAVLDAVRARGKPCAVVVITSDKCYENREHVWGYREIDALGGHDPYSASKGAAELVASAYRRSFFPPPRLPEHGIRLATARAGNVIGGGDWATDRIIPDAVRHLVAGRPVPVRNPRAVRPWQHVLEPLGGYLTLAARLLRGDDARFCDAWNFGPPPGQELPVADLVQLFLAAWGQGEWQDASAPGQPHEANVLRLSIDKSLAQLGWRPVWTPAEAIQRSAHWYRRFYAGGESMRNACCEDIAAYERAACADWSPRRTMPNSDTSEQGI